jgi:large subunit ribosomal protein L25
MGMVELAAKKREITGKKTRSLRKTGSIPAVLYGYKEESQPILVEQKSFEHVWKEAGESSIISLNLEGEGVKNVLIHDVALDPRKDLPLHVDFYAVRMDKPIEASVPVSFTGESEAVKALSGVLVKVAHEIEIRALPKDLPHELEADISKLVTFEDRLTIADIKFPQGVEPTGDSESVVALVEAPRTQAELEALDQATEAPSIESIEVAGKKAKEEGEEGAETEGSTEA